jgi:hypothetical protein
MITQTLHELRRRGGGLGLTPPVRRVGSVWPWCWSESDECQDFFLDIRKDGIGILTMDVPGESMNTP